MIDRTLQKNMSSLKKLTSEAAGRHIWGCVRSTHPHICRPKSSTCGFCSGLKYGMTFDEFEEQNIVEREDYTWDVESDAIEWD